MTRMPRRAALLLATLATLMSVPAFAPASTLAADTTLATTSTDVTVDQAEAEMVRLLNEDRTTRGIAAVRVDPRVMTIARARSTDMATKGYFDHLQPDGRTVFDMIQAAGIAWSSAGEIIAWNTWPTLLSSAAAANQGWLDSPGHYAILTDSSYNSLGVGLAVDSTGKKLWTAVFVREPTTTVTSVTTVAAPSRPSFRVTLSANHHHAYLRWGTPTAPAGIKYYQVQKRVGTGAWAMILRTTAHSATRYTYLHRHYRFRVRAIDTLGHAGTWSYVRSVWT
jgi:uncharacterized protein YkwD